MHVEPLPPRETWNLVALDTFGPTRFRIAQDGARACGVVPAWSPSWGRYVVVRGGAQYVWDERDPVAPLLLWLGVLLVAPLSAFGVTRWARRRRKRPRWLAVRGAAGAVTLREPARPTWALHPLDAEITLATLGGALEGSSLTLRGEGDGVYLSHAAVVWEPDEAAPYHAADGSHVPTGTQILGEGAPVAILSEAAAARLRAGAGLESASDAAIEHARGLSPIAFGGPTPTLGHRVVVSFGCGIAIGVAVATPYALFESGWIWAGVTSVAVGLSAVAGAAVGGLLALVIPLPRRPRFDA